MVQVYRTIGDYRAGRYPNLAFVDERHVYPTVVTLEDWYWIGRELPDRLETAVRTAIVAGGLPMEWLDEMSYSIMSVDEFEKGTGVINIVSVHPFISGMVLDPERRRWAYGAYCSDRYKDEVTNLPGIFHDEYDEMFAGLGE